MRQAIFVRDMALHTLRGSCYCQVLAFKVHQPGQEERGLRWPAQVTRLIQAPLTQSGSSLSTLESAVVLPQPPSPTNTGFRVLLGLC